MGWQFYDSSGRKLNTTSTLIDNLDIDGALGLMQGLRPRVDAYFDKVLVMADDEALRRNRLALVYAIAAIPDGVVDLSQVMGF